MRTFKDPANRWPTVEDLAQHTLAIEVLREFIPTLGSSDVTSIARATYRQPKTLDVLERVLLELAPELFEERE